ncbi:NUDIX domain-containing protein [Dyella terrae]|uniref:NUDIX domain-containing protein n=3 Tax=Rhodanobacteraceae TaxID=1775411 RepID=A0A4V2NMH2_9GAMM|nr:NUDIX domain-containing protein [Dyella terrae]TCI13297.1 NUDIX domain-containing protein [Dyella soli]
MGHFRRYAARHPEEAGVADQFMAFLASAPSVFERSHRVGHFTASAWLVSGDGERLLLTHHRKLNRWLQLGGHADGSPDLAEVALREAEEESGLTDLCVEDELFDIDRHWIPERGSEPGHWHYDVRYVVRATGTEAFVVSEESLALEWRPIPVLIDEPGTDESLRRMADKWLARAIA